MRLAAALLIVFLCSSPCLARTWHIEPDGSGDMPTIQMGIAAAAEGDTVLLADAVFTGTGNWNLDLLGKAIAVRSTSGDPVECTIDIGGSYAHRGFSFQSGEGPESRIEGLTIASGSHSQGGGIMVQGSSPTVVDCRIIGCVSQSDGGAVLCTNGGSPVFERCVLEGNSALFSGGAIRIGMGTSATLTGCTLRANAATQGGGVYSYGGMVTLTSSTLADNRAGEDGGGVFLHGGGGAIHDCVFVRNVAEAGRGGGVYCANSSPDFARCSFWGNAAEAAGGIHCRIAASPTIHSTLIAFSAEGCAISCDGAGDQPVLACCDLYGNPGGDWIGGLQSQYGVDGNFSADPLFCDPDLEDFTLRSDSPCLAGNHPNGADCGRIGTFGEGCEGPTAVRPASWGSVKSLFR